MNENQRAAILYIRRTYQSCELVRFQSERLGSDGSILVTFSFGRRWFDQLTVISTVGPRGGIQRQQEF
jgi:hypothetical protein